MSEPLTGTVVTTAGTFPAIQGQPDPRPYVTYLAHLKSAESRRTMHACLDRIAAMIGQGPARAVPWHGLRYEHTSVIQAMIMGCDWSPSHKNKHLSALRGVIKQCWKLGLIGADERDRACDVDSDDGKRQRAGRNISSEEMAAMLAACASGENTPLGIRDAALLTLLYRTGVRREEAAKALIEKYDPGRRALRVIGKGDRERKVYVPLGAVGPVERWLVTVGARSGPIFRPVDRWGNIMLRHMSTRAIGRMVAKRQSEAQVAPLSTHDFRRTFGGDFLDSGGDLVQLQQLMGHASATTTASYDRRPEEALLKAVDRLKMPAPKTGKQ